MQGIYPDYDVMALKEEWDGNTRRLVESRLKIPDESTYFNQKEFSILAAAAARLMADDDYNLLLRVCGQMDHKFASQRGEGFYEENLPPTPILIKRGLNNLDAAATGLFGKGFAQLSPDLRDDLLNAAAGGNVAVEEWGQNEQKKFFTKLLTNLADFFFSQPEIWSEMGYGGPAYPRGYVRIEKDLLDPWEPKSSEKFIQERIRAGLGPVIPVDHDQAFTKDSKQHSRKGGE